MGNAHPTRYLIFNCAQLLNAVLSRRPNSPYFLAQVLKIGSRNDKIAAARNPNTTISILKQLAKDPDETIRSVISGNSSLPLESLLELAEDSNVNIRATLARNISCHQVLTALAERLANDESSKVCSIIAANSYTPAKELRQLANDIDYEVKKSLVGNQNTPVDILNQLGTEEGIFDVRNPNTPGAVLDRAIKLIQQGKGSTTLENFLKHPVKGSQMPAETLTKLANSTNSSVRYRVAQHPNTLSTTLEQLANDNFVPTLIAVGENLNTPPHILDRLANHSDLNTCARIVHNPNTLSSTLARIVNSSTSSDNTLVFGNY